MSIDMLTINEVAERLKLSVITIRRLVSRGELKAYRLGGRQLRFKESEIAAYIDAQLIQPGTNVSDDDSEA